MRFAVPTFALCASLLVLPSAAGADVLRQTKATSITVSDAGGGAPPVAGDPYPSSIEVSGQTRVVTDVKVTLNDVEHAFPGDMDVLLEGPTGGKALLMSDSGGGHNITGVDLTFDDAAAALLPEATPITSGTYRPTDYSAGDPFPPEAPAGPFGTSLGNAFDGTNANGSWNLYAVDDAGNDGGKIAGGWTLTLTLGSYIADGSQITIADGSPPTMASPYPSQIQTSSIFGEIKEVSVRLYGFGHEDPGDVDVMLEGPSGERTTLISDAGGVDDVTARDLRFDDDAQTTVPESGVLESGSYKPTNHQGADAFPGPAPAQEATPGLGVFEGTTPNGVWKLWVMDDASGAAGKIAGGWSLQVTLRSGVRFEQSSLIAGEGDGTKTLVIERPEGGGAATVHYELPDAGHAKDVKPASGNVAFAIGQKKRSLPVTLIDDVGHEPIEYAALKLTTVAGDAWTPEEGRIDYLQINDNDMADAREDFNGDGRADLAIGVPKEDLVGGADAGAVQVLYGTDGGLSAAADQRFTQDTAGMPDVAEPNDQFGAAVAASDFDGDGFGDLAIGAPGEDDAGVTDMGRVTILYGSANGLQAAGSLLLGQGSPGVPDDNEPSDRFGAALAAGNLGRTAHGDLVIGQPGEDLAALNGAGAVTALYGTANGLGTAGAALWHQDVAAVEQDAEAGDAFGSVLAIGDFGSGAEGDLAVGVPAENAGRGVVQVLYGTTADGLAAAGDKLFSQSTPGIGQGAIAEDGDNFGAALAAGEMGGRGGAEDLAIGTPNENLSGIADTGVVHVLRGDGGPGLTVKEAEYFTQADGDINTGNGANDRFGAAVAIGDFGSPNSTPAKAGGDGGRIAVFQVSDDLAIGVPGETVGGVKAGAVQVVYGNDFGAGSGFNNKQWHQGEPGVADDNEAGDQFGASLARGRYRGPSNPDALAVGVPGEGVGQAAGAGGVAVLHASISGLFSADSQRWAQGAGGVQDAAEAGDAFGGVLAP